MCLIGIAFQQHSDYPLLLLANRDEFHSRPTQPTAFWPDHPTVVAGRDLQGGGTWMGFSTSGRFAAVTNFRDPSRHKQDAPTRGGLVVDWITGERPYLDFGTDLLQICGQFNGFNLLFGDARQLWYLTNITPSLEQLEPGIHAVSNHLLNSDWPKCQAARDALRQTLSMSDLRNSDVLFDCLTDRTIAGDERLPSTGVPLALERSLSAVFVQLPGYGTRSSTVAAMAHDGNGLVLERTWDEQGLEGPAVELPFQWRINSSD